ncbi:MAG: SH3 domain-containing protein [Clostridia bacterium]|nr:SH3 domain-containing protein [Clostridia bacterium]
MANYAIFPMHNLKVSQNYKDSYSHAGHFNGTPRDYPIDISGKDTGREYFYAPCDLKVWRVYGVYDKGTNTIFLRSTAKVNMPCGKSDYLCIMCIHPNDDDLQLFKAGQVYKKGARMFREGADGNANGNHVHMSLGLGSFVGTGWRINNKGAWVITTTGGAIKPEDALYIDKSFTKVLGSAGITFKELPKQTSSPQSNKVEAAHYGPVRSLSGFYKTTANLRLRTGAGTNKAIITTMPAGAVVRNYGYYNLDSGGIKWLCVMYNGVTGYCSSEYLRRT